MFPDVQTVLREGRMQQRNTDWDVGWCVHLPEELPLPDCHGASDTCRHQLVLDSHGLTHLMEREGVLTPKDANRNIYVT